MNKYETSSDLRSAQAGKSRYVTSLRILSAFYFLMVLTLPATAQSLSDSMLVAPVMSQKMAGTDPVLRFSFQGTGPTSELSTIEPPSVLDPQYVTFNAQGELFVANRSGNSISRFKFSDDGGFSPNGVITKNGLEGGVWGVAFSPSGELFAASYVNGTISRFQFDANGHAVPNGMFSVAVGLQGLAFNRVGELFSANLDAKLIYRYLFNESGNPVPNGAIPADFGIGPIGISFSPSGELFVADATGAVRRFLFNAQGDAVPNGTIATPIPFVMGTAFSQAGELFVSGQQSRSIYRYLFDPDGKAIAHGEVTTSEVGFGMPAIFPSALPSALRIKAVAVSPTSIRLSWGDNFSDEKGFRIQRKDGACNSTNPWSTRADVSANSETFLDGQLLADTPYAYRVRRYYGGSNFSAYSRCAAATTGAAGTPQLPSTLRAQSVSSSRVNLHWDDVSEDETAFEIYRQDGSGSMTLLDTVAESAQSFSDTTATGNDTTTSYHYDVRACNASGCSMPAPAPVVPFKPVSLKATVASKVQLTWQDQSNDESGFQIERKNGVCGSGNPWVQVGRVAANTQAYQDSSAVKGTVYAYRVRAYYDTGVLLRGFPGSQAYGFSGFTGCVSATAP